LVRRSHCAVGLSLGSVDFPWRGWPATFQRPVKSPLVEFRVPPEYYPVVPSRSAAAVQLLSWAFGPYSTCRKRRSTIRELAWLTTLRLQGLVTLLTAYSLRILGGSISHRRRSWGLPFGVDAVDRYSNRFRPNQPTYRFSCRCFPVPKHLAGPTGRGSWVLTLSRAPIDQTVGLAPPPSGDSLGFYPSRAFEQKP
jgi:hypothetical protein